MSTEPQQLQFEASGIRFAALSWPAEPPADDAPLALCLHGYPDTAWTWRWLGPVLAARGWRVVAPFMRGYAPTGLAPDGVYQVGALVHDVADAYSALGGDSRAVLIGHDWGAVTAYATGSCHPELFARIVTLGWCPAGALFRSMRNPVLVLRQLRCSWYMAFNQLSGVAERSLGRLIPRLWADWAPGYDAADDLPGVWAALPDRAHRTAALRYYRSLVQPWRWSRRYLGEQRHILGAPRCPTLYLHGRDDGCLRAEVAKRATQVLADGSEVAILDDAGHFPQLEQPADVNRRIATFLGR